MVRLLFVLASLAALVGGALLFLTGAARGPDVAREAAVGAPERGALDLVRSVAAETRRPSPREEVDAGGDALTLAPVPELEAAPAALEESWRRCWGMRDDAELRACFRAWLSAHAPDPVQLAEEICRDDHPDVQRFIEEAVATWSASTAARGIQELREGCPRLEVAWVDFIGRQAYADPEWAQTFGASLRPDHLFDGSEETGFIGMAHRLAQLGDGDLQGLLEEGARGEWGGSPEQVAETVAKAWDLQADEEGRLTFLRSVVDAPTFQGRDFEVDAVVGWSLHPRGIPADATGSIAFVRELMADPRWGSRAAEHVLVLSEWGQLPQNYHIRDRRALVDYARTLTGDSP